ncbi:MAG: hypothetical protein ACRDYA_08395 [Egibacteraceae bacterium]
MPRLRVARDREIPARIPGRSTADEERELLQLELRTLLPALSGAA